MIFSDSGSLFISELSSLSTSDIAVSSVSAETSDSFSESASSCVFSSLNSSASSSSSIGETVWYSWTKSCLKTSAEIVSSAISLSAITVFLSLSLSTVGSSPE